MLAAQRFNRFHLALGIGYDFARGMRDSYFYFPYPFLLHVPGYDVRAGGVSDQERERNLDALRFVAAETRRRGLHFQLGLWASVYEFQESPAVNHPISGLTPETHAPYCRDALRTLLQAIPEIDGVTLRVHGESGIPEGSYDFWETVLAGIAGCGRRVQLDLHSKGIDGRMIDLALATGQPVEVSPKFWAEHLGLPYHQAEIRALEQPGPPSDTHGADGPLHRVAALHPLRLRRPPARRTGATTSSTASGPAPTASCCGATPSPGGATPTPSPSAGQGGWSCSSPWPSPGAGAPGAPGGAIPTPTPTCAPSPATGSSTPTPTACGGACSTIPGPARSSGAPPWRRSWAGPGQPRRKPPWPAPAASCPW